MNPCGSCERNVFNPSTLSTHLQCSICHSFFHKQKKCSFLKPHEVSLILSNNTLWTCNNCMAAIFPFSSVEQVDFLSLFSPTIQIGCPVPNKKSKCGQCSNRINQFVYLYCHSCQKYFHLYHYSLKKKNLPLPPDWACDSCTISVLPFSNITKDDFLFTIHGISEKISEPFSGLSSFSIKSLLDKLPGQKISTDEFLSNSIESKYFTPAEFINEKFDKKPFSMVHLNIASLQKHIDELRSFLALLNHPFHIICISETRLYDDKPLANVSIDGYNLVHTPTKSGCGGVAI